MNVAKDLLQQIAHAERAIASIKKKISKLRDALVECESEVIAETLLKERLQEKLRVHRNTTIDLPLTARDQEIEAFRKKFPELCKVNEDGDA